MIPFLAAALLAREAQIDSPMRCVALSSLKGRVSTTSTLEHEVVLTPDAIGEEEAKALALSLHADLTRVGNVWHVFRRPETSMALAKADGDSLVAQVGAALRRVDALTAPFAKAPEEAPFRVLEAERTRLDAWTEAERLQGRTAQRPDSSGVDAAQTTPASRLLADLLRTLPDGLLRNAPPGRITVFSNDPHGVERLLPVPEATLAHYVEAEERFVDWTAAIEPSLIPERYRWTFPNRSSGPGIRTARLSVSRQGEDVGFGLGVYDRLGRLEAVGSLTARSLEDLYGPLPRAQTHLGKVRLSPTTGNDATGLSSNLDPVVRDPLDREVRDALVRWSRAKGFERVVACVPDDLMTALPKCFDGKDLDLDRLSVALDQTSCESLPVGRTLVVRPIHPLQEEATRVDRRPMSTLFRAAARGEFSLDDLLAYHAAYLNDYDRPLVNRMETPIRDGFDLNEFPAWGLPHVLLGVVGTVGPDDRRILDAGEPVSLNGPDYAACRSSLAAYAANHSAPPSSAQVPPDGTHMIPSQGAAEFSGSDLERTSTWIAARPGDWRLQTRAVNSSTLLRRVEKASGQTVDRRPMSLAMLTGGGVLNVQEDLVPRYRFLWTQERTTRFDFDLGGGEPKISIDLRERGPESTQAVSLDMVPGIGLPTPSP